MDMAGLITLIIHPGIILLITIPIMATIVIGQDTMQVITPDTGMGIMVIPMEVVITMITVIVQQLHMAQETVAWEEPISHVTEVPAVADPAYQTRKVKWLVVVP